jgi:hypothetical protein
MPVAGFSPVVNELNVKIAENLTLEINGREYEVGITSIDPSDPSMVYIGLMGWVKQK